MYGSFSIRASNIYSENFIQDALAKKYHSENSTPKRIKYFLTKNFIENY